MAVEASARSGRLLWVRHGESEGNRDRRFTQSTAVALTEMGREQAHAAAVAIRRHFAPTLIVASPFTRARQTAEIIASALSLPLELDEDIREQSMGHLAGLPYESALAAPDFDAAHRWAWRPPGGESLVDIQPRVRRALDRFAQAHPSRDIVVVAHAGVMHTVWATITGSWHDAPHTPNASILLVEHEAGCYRRATVFEEK